MGPARSSATALLAAVISLAAVGCSMDRRGFAAVGDTASIPPPAPGFDAGATDATPIPGAPTDAMPDARALVPDLGPSPPPPPPPPPPDAGPDCDPEGCCPRCATGHRCVAGLCMPPTPPPPCGAEGAPCCADGRCAGGLSCAGGTCSACGSRPGSPCCEGGRCGSGMSCDYIGGTMQCYVCGQENQFCCQLDEPCEDDLYCSFTSGRCRRGF